MTNGNSEIDDDLRKFETVQEQAYRRARHFVPSQNSFNRDPLQVGTEKQREEIFAGCNPYIPNTKERRLNLVNGAVMSEMVKC